MGTKRHEGVNLIIAAVPRAGVNCDGERNGPAGRSLQCDSCWTSQLTAQETACLEAQPRRRETELPQEARFLTRFPTGASTFDAVRVCLEIRTLDAKTLRRRERRR